MMSEINKRIREEMNRQGLTMTDLARLSGLNRSSISRYVSDTIEPKQNAIGAIAHALKVSPAWLLGFSSKPDCTITDGKHTIIIDNASLTESNQARLLAYYEGLIASQEEGHGNT